MKANRTCVITSNWEKGAGKIGTSLGPSRIKSLLESNTLGQRFIETITVESKSTIEPNSSQSIEFNPAKHIEELIQHSQQLSTTVEDCIISGYNALVLSGDHSNAIGTVSGLCRSLGGENIGVIWIDAHLDLHSPYTTPSGNIHGMSVNALLGDDNKDQAVRILTQEQLESWNSLKTIKNNKPQNCILPKNLIFIATRSFEKEEWALIQKHNILVITVQEIKENGNDWLNNQINEHLKHCLYRYVSFDVDSLDSSISSATGTPEPQGLNIEISSYLFEQLWNHPQTVCMEITEFNPSLPEPEKLDHALMNCFQSVVI